MTKGKEKFWSSVYDIGGGLVNSAKEFYNGASFRFTKRSPDKVGDKHFGPIRIRRK